MKKILDLGYQPLANSYLSSKELHKHEKKFKLEIGFNPKTILFQFCIPFKRKNV